MALIKKPVTGMKDILPQEMQIRDYVMSAIKENYRKFGFTPIDTPCVENIENLSNKQGGENEKLIFKILKRGEKLNLETAKEEMDLVDGGLRYDLTVPLVRFYSNNANILPSPFKALQIGSVWRADRPQKGRFRQFVQCDIDILGEASNLAEIELIIATTTTLAKLGFENFKVRINDRQILRAMATYSGFAEDQYDTVFIILDKMDKIGLDGVAKELLESGFIKESVDKYLELFNGIEAAENGIVYLSDKLSIQQAWQIPLGNAAKTTISPKGYLLFSADNEPSQGLLHAGFSLDKDGEAVFLFRIEGLEIIVLDSLRFGAQRANISYGRYPDGSANIEFMTLSTPRAANYFNPVGIGSVRLPQPTDKLTVYPVPTHGRLFVKFNDLFQESGNTVRINIYSATGRLISSTQQRKSGLIELSLDRQPQGMYLLKIIGDSEVFERKIIVY